MRIAEAKKKREADSIGHINGLKLSYSSYRFLFANDESFISCITLENPITIEIEIMSLIDQKMDELSYIIVKGTEFKDEYIARISMEGICDISNCMRFDLPEISDYAENKLIDFVNERKTLSKAYNKAKKKDPNLKCSEFLASYINDNKDNKSGNRKTANGSQVLKTLGVVGGVAVAVGAYVSYLYFLSKK